MFTRPRIIPVMLLDDRDLVKTKQFNNPVYLGDPVNAVKIFNLKGIDEMAILDISATRRGTEPDYQELEDIASQAFMPLSYGGGVKTVEQAKKILALGYEKIVLNTELVNNSELISECVSFAGSQSIVASIDAKIVNGKYRAIISDGSIVSDYTPKELAIRAEELGCGEIFLNSIDRDGMMDGYDIELVRDVSEAVNIPVTACGGAGGIKDLKKVLDEGHAHAAAGGSMFVFYGRLKAVLITFPMEKDFIEEHIFSDKTI